MRYVYKRIEFFKNNSRIRQQGTVPLYILLSVIGLIIFLVIITLSPLKNNFLAAFFPKPASHAANPILDLTNKLENLGNPAKSRWPDSNQPCIYARNVWDMQSFNGRVYLGSGNSSNTGPCVNAGPVDLWYFDPTSNQFLKDISTNSACGSNCLDDEQIAEFKLMNNGQSASSSKLYVPSKDPKEGWEFGNIYINNGVSWTKYRSIPNAVHTFDVASYAGKLFAAISSQDTSANGSVIFISSDDGLSWTKSNMQMFFAMESFFTLNGSFYATASFTNGGVLSLATSIYRYSGGTNFTAVPNSTLPFIFPNNGLPSGQTSMLFKPTNYLNKLVYLGSMFTTNDGQMDPYALYTTSNLTDAARISLPGNAKPWDLLVGQDGKLYVLGSIPNGNRFWVTVNSTTDLVNWSEEFRFDSQTFARSFEIVNGDFYFGLGTDATALSSSTGDILRVKAAELNPATPSASSLSGPINPSPSPSKVGDIDGNNKVDIFDYNILLTNFGKTGVGIEGDITPPSGSVDIFDYNTLLSNFGT